MNGYQSDLLANIDPASETKPGIARFATDEELLNEQLQEKVVVASTQLLTLLKRYNLLYQQMSTVAAPTLDTTEEVNFPGEYLVPAGFIPREEGLRILIAGSFRHSFPRQSDPVDKTLRVYVGDAMVLVNQAITSPEGHFKAEIVLYNVGNIVQKGWSFLQINGQPTETIYQQPAANNWATDDLVIRMTAQTPVNGQRFLIDRFTWTIERIV